MAATRSPRPRRARDRRKPRSGCPLGRPRPPRSAKPACRGGAPPTPSWWCATTPESCATSVGCPTPTPRWCPSPPTPTRAAASSGIRPRTCWPRPFRICSRKPSSGSGRPSPTASTTTSTCRSRSPRKTWRRWKSGCVRSSKRVSCSSGGCMSPKTRRAPSWPTSRTSSNSSTTSPGIPTSWRSAATSSRPTTTSILAPENGFGATCAGGRTSRRRSTSRRSS